MSASKTLTCWVIVYQTPNKDNYTRKEKRGKITPTLNALNILGIRNKGKPS